MFTWRSTSAWPIGVSKMKAYYVVAAKDSKLDAWSVQFGDYDREVAQDELCDMNDSGDWYKLKLITVKGDRQIDIDNAISKLNTAN